MFTVIISGKDFATSFAVEASNRHRAEQKGIELFLKTGDACEVLSVTAIPY